jgi:hypothetical protein
MARWDWTKADLDAALDAAREGKGSRLAKLVKVTSESDLARGLSRSGGRLELALYFCLGLREERAYIRDLRAQMRKGDRS